MAEPRTAPRVEVAVPNARPRVTTRRVRRWKFVDTGTGEQWVLPLNPNAMSAPPKMRSLRHGASIRAGRERPRSISGPVAALPWEFSGVIRTQAHHDKLLAWARHENIVEVHDHLGRVFEVVFTTFDPVDRKPTPLTPWRLTYTMKTLVLRRRG